MIRYPLRWLLLTGAMVSAAHASLSVEGGDAEVRTTIQAYLQDDLASCVEGNRTDPDVIRRKTRTALDALGHFQATIATAWREECDLLVQLGSVGRPSIRNWQLRTLHPDLLAPEDLQWLRQSRGLSGEFRPSQYEVRKLQVLNELRDRGYVDATYETSDARVYVADNVVDVDWVIQTGPQYIVRDVLTDQSVLSEDMFVRYLEVSPGAALRQSSLQASYDNILASDYFSRVRVTPVEDSKRDGEIDVRVVAQAAEPWTLLSGFGFATDSGPRLRGQLNARYLNEQGHKLNLSSLVAPVQGHAKAEYRWPYGDPTHQWYSVETRVSYENTDTSKSVFLSAGLRRVSRVSDNWVHMAYTDFVTERFDIASQDDQSQFLWFGSNLTYTSSIDSVRPRSGRSVSIDIRGAHTAVLSDTNFILLRLRGKTILPFVNNTRWIVRGELGAVWQAEFRDLPSSLRFFAGGDSSVRGYAFESLGSGSDDAVVTGGERLTVASVEYDIPVGQQWSLAMFVDSGAAYTDSPTFHHSVGAGFRWYSPLGPIRVDLAHPLTRPQTGVRLHISIGPDV